ncbi:MAG TPA: hypothetical protein VFZ61_34815, partial [Polyangiales bacterium]
MMQKSELPRLTRIARALVYALCAAAFAFPLAQIESALCAALFASLGVALVAPRLAATRVRTAWLLVLGAVAALLCHALALGLGRSSGLGSWLGAARFLVLRDALDFGLISLCIASTLPAVSQRLRWFAFVEVALCGMVASQLVSDHRHGAINRPFEVADPILSAGGDPTFVFYAIGGLCALLLALVLIVERRWWRLLLHLSILGALLLLLGLGVSSGVLPQPQPAGDGLGLKGKPNEDKKQEARGNKQDKTKRPDNDMLEFRDQEQNRDQQTPVAVVLLHDDYSAPQGVYYFRQGAFSQFNGRRLIAATRDKLDRDILGSFPVDTAEVQDAPQPGSERATIETTVALLADHTRPFGLESPVSFSAALNPNPERFRRVYTAVSSALTADLMSLLGRRAENPSWTAEERAHYLALPSDPRYAELAKKLIDELSPDLKDDPMLKAWAITEWLSKEATYSLRSKHAAAEDPTADFLFGD